MRNPEQIAELSLLIDSAVNCPAVERRESVTMRQFLEKQLEILAWVLEDPHGNQVQAVIEKTRRFHKALDVDITVEWEKRQ